MERASRRRARVAVPEAQADVSPYPDETDDSFIDTLIQRTRWLRAYFRLHVEGLENVPKRAALLVANHNAGGPFEILLIQHAWREAFGLRAIRGLTHGMAWKLPFSLVRLPQKMGAILARPDVAKQALVRGQCVLVFPGAENEALRPFSERNNIDFGHRTGFIRVAREMEAPIAPWVICGSHTMYTMLPGGQRLSSLLGLDRRLRLKTVPLTLGAMVSGVILGITCILPRLLPGLVLALAAAAIPNPSRVHMRILQPFYVRRDETDTEASTRLQGLMRAAMQDMAAKRRTPWG